MDKFSQHTQVTAVCVRVALESVEADIRRELETCQDEAVEALQRVLAKLDDRKKVVTDLAPIRISA